MLLHYYQSCANFKQIANKKFVTQRSLFFKSVNKFTTRTTSKKENTIYVTVFFYLRLNNPKLQIVRQRQPYVQLRDILNPWTNSACAFHATKATKVLAVGVIGSYCAQTIKLWSLSAKRGKKEGIE